MGRTLGIMFTATTYGQWLRGDRRGWVDDGRILPPDPEREDRDRARLKHEPYMFPQPRLFDIGQAMVMSLTQRMELTVLSLTVQTWHAHVVVAATPHDIADVAKCFKDAARYHLRPGRPIWAAGYDKRFCFNAESLRHRIDYVARHNQRIGFSPFPFAGLAPPGSDSVSGQ